MKVNKFENIKENNYNFNYKYGGHCFVLARFKNGWNNYFDVVPFDDDEFVPCMISGNPNPKASWQKYDLYIIGETRSYNIDDFEIVSNSDIGFNDMIKIYATTNKFNI